MQYSSLIPALNKLATDAGYILMKHFSPTIEVEVKGDNSPVTLADKEADAFISKELQKLTPDIPVISEEGSLENLPDTDTYWLVDPLDGTRSFINGEKEFTVNIGLVKKNRAVEGVIYAPAYGVLYYTKDGKAYRFANGSTTEMKVAPKLSGGLRVIASKNHRNKLTEEYIQTLNVKEFVASASSYKFCLLAEGLADIYPRFGNTMQWDTAAGQAILEAAGGKMTKPDGSDFTYELVPGDNESLRNGHFIASN